MQSCETNYEKTEITADCSQEEKSKRIIDALIKKAVGYDLEEISAEFDGENNLLKKKVQTKHFPPDTMAAKIVLEFFGQSVKTVEDMSDEELEEELKRILREMEN